MQIKKTDWINKPEKVHVSAHSLRFRAEKKAAVLYTLERDGRLRLIRHNDSVSFLMLHTKEDRIIITESLIDIKFRGLKEKISIPNYDEIIIEKKSDEITFYSPSLSPFFSLSDDAFALSASFGFLVAPSSEEILVEFY